MYGGDLNFFKYCVNKKEYFLKNFVLVRFMNFLVVSLRLD